MSKYLRAAIWLALAAFVCTMSDAQSPYAKGNAMKVFTPPEIEAYNIQLVHSTKADPAILSATLGKDAAAMTSLLPYAVVLVNNSGRRILQQTIKFTWVNPNGQPQGTYLSLDDFSERPPGWTLPTVQHKIIVPQRGLNIQLGMDPSERPLLGAEWVDIISHTKANFDGVTQVSASVDSLTIEGIGLVGPDVRNNRANGYDRKTKVSAADLGDKK